MNRKIILTTIIIYFTCLIACNSESKKSTVDSKKAVESKETLAGVWKATGFDRTSEKITKLEERYTDKMKYKGSEMYLFPDKTLSRYAENTPNNGKWSFDEQTNLLLLNYGKFTDTLKNIGFSKKGTIRFFDAELAGAGTIKFVEHSNMMTDYNTMPFYPNNLLWKRKPNKKETEAELKQRILNYVSHFAFLFKAATDDDNKNSKVSFKRSKGVIKVYQRKIGAVKEADIPSEWYDYFYSKEQAMEAYKYFKKQLGKGQITEGRDKSWMRENFTILALLAQKIEEDINKK